MRGRGFRLTAALAVLALPGCGPTPEEAGGAVLLVTPLVILAGGVLLWILFQLWRTSMPGIRFRWRPTLMAAGVAALASGLVLAIAHDLDKTMEWIIHAIWAFGTSYAAVLLLAWRIGMFRRPGGRMPVAFTWAHIVPIMLLVLPALAMLLGVAPIWCLGVVLALPLAVRVFRQAREVEHVAALMPAVIEFSTVFVGQVVVGYIIKGIVR